AAPTRSSGRRPTHHARRLAIRPLLGRQLVRLNRAEFRFEAGNGVSKRPKPALFGRPFRQGGADPRADRLRPAFPHGLGARAHQRRIDGDREPGFALAHTIIISAYDTNESWAPRVQTRPLDSL